MYTPRLFITVSLAIVLGGCSKTDTTGKELVRADDLGLQAGPRPVVSAVELGGTAVEAPKPAPQRARVRTVTNVARPNAQTVAETPVIGTADVATPAVKEETAVAAAAPEPVSEVSAPEREGDRHPTHRGGSGGTYPGAEGTISGPMEGSYPGVGDYPGVGGGVHRIPGIAGPVVIRGGRGSGWDPCVKHGPSATDRVTGVVMRNPRMPATGGVSGGGRGGRFGGR